MIFLRSFLAAAFLAASFPVLSLWPLAFVSFALVASVFLDESIGRKSMALYWGSFAFWCNIIGFYWIIYTVHEFAELSYFISFPLGMLLFVALSVFSFLMGALWYELRKRLPTSLYFRAGVLLLFLGLWDFMDVRMFPWAPMMGLAGNANLLASVAILDSWGWRLLFPLMSFLIYFAATKSQSLKQRGASLGLFLALLGTVLYLGYNSKAKLQKEYAFRQPVAILQGNIGNYEKRQSESGVEPTVRNVLGIYRDLIEEAATVFSEDAVEKNIEPWFVWPETSFPGFPLRDPPMQRQLDYWLQLSRGLHLLGAYEDGTMFFNGKEKPTEYNIALMIHESQGYVGHYRKMELMPYGEYFPGDALLPSIYDWIPQINHFGRGEEFKFLVHPDPEGPIFLPVICYEVLFDRIVNSFLKVAKEKYPGREVVIYNPTNDSWFGKTVEPFMHARLAQWQAARISVSLLRATNTGVSMIVAPWGEVLKEGPLFSKAVIYGELPVKRLQKRILKVEAK